MTHKSHVTQTQPTVFRRMNVALNGNGFLYIKWRKKMIAAVMMLKSNRMLKCLAFAGASRYK